MTRNQNADRLKTHIEDESRHSIFLVLFGPLFDWSQYLNLNITSDKEAKDKADEIMNALIGRRDSFIQNYQFSYLQSNHSLTDTNVTVFFVLEQINTLLSIIQDFKKGSFEATTHFRGLCKDILLSIDKRAPELIGNEFYDFDSIDEIAEAIDKHIDMFDCRLGDLHDDLASFDASIVLFNEMIERLSLLINEL